ncbi:hypothetical protein QUF84_07895 [Fictibacillus enclensis]|uniref:Uncharacterized protein n=2 Tax=Fictibacillus TaxID=1329200 RepID=A0A1G9THT0_9BACL|nr:MULTISPECIES: hypothetical protein [Fictibacillus]MDM5197991.1 hypothetical protein [Fictibacillus enclensis]MDM5337135.1 hypothetical protein [Fictibacillus enclensis]MDN4524526.1 hypothetical protein [Fictibacillus sp. NE201]WHY73566.1 hypothetical protein QNH15_06550 [Fictibacillus enclensis]SCB77114.1 hypothetical protein GA0061096_0386 [Fictibacillus enclensis]
MEINQVEQPVSKQITQSVPKQPLLRAAGTLEKPDENRKPEYELTFLNPN